jgi:type I restriction enzyme S subunit
LVVVKKPIGVLPDFLCFYLNSLAEEHISAGTVGIALTHFNTKSVALMPIPLPPLAEQHRIVAKVDELMTLVDRLKADLAESRTQQDRLATTLIEAALKAA